MRYLYKAEDLRLQGRLTTIKAFQTDPNAAPDQREQSRRQFQREASRLARLDHPNLPKVSDFFVEDDRDFLVMDFVPGLDLQQGLEKTQHRAEFLPEQQALGWAEQIAPPPWPICIRRIPPVLHQDIKPSNIKLTPAGLIKLVDFGLVKILAAGDNRTITIMQGRGRRSTRRSNNTAAT